MPLFERIEFGSGHGTNTGIYPRFYLQVREIAKISKKSKDEIDDVFWTFHQQVIPDITDFYDIYHDIKNVYDDYNTGLRNGIYFKLDDQGTFVHNRKPEIEFINKSKMFFIKGRILLNNFSKSSILKNEYFDLELLLLVKETNFQKNKNKLLRKDPIQKYSRLFELTEEARKEFLMEFNQIRAEIEHNNFKIAPFQIQVEKEQVLVTEPSIFNDFLIDKMTFYYHRILRTLELLMVWFYAIQAYFAWNQTLTLFRREEFDPKKLYYEFIMLPRVQEGNLIQLIFP